MNNTAPYLLGVAQSQREEDMGVRRVLTSGGDWGGSERYFWPALESSMEGTQTLGKRLQCQALLANKEHCNTDLDRLQRKAAVEGGPWPSGG